MKNANTENRLKKKNSLTNCDGRIKTTRNCREEQAKISRINQRELKQLQMESELVYGILV